MEYNDNYNLNTFFMAYLTLFVIMAALLFYIFRVRARKIPDTPVKEETTPQRKWVFNGILDIDNPPPETEVFVDYTDRMELRVKPGFIHYDLVMDERVDDSLLGLYNVEVRVENNRIGVYSKKGRIGFLPDGQQQLLEKLKGNGGKAEKAYAFVARRKTQEGNTYWGEVALS